MDTPKTVNNRYILILPYVLPVAHIGIVIIIAIITIVVDLILLYILLVAHVEVVILP